MKPFACAGFSKFWAIFYPLDREKRQSSFAAHSITYWPDDKAGALSLTFDDGPGTHYSSAIPALNARGFQGTFFVTTTNATSGTGGYAPWDNWRAAASMGHEIGSHTKTHPDLTTLAPAAMQDEIVGSKTVIDAQITSQKCVSFDYPYGSYNNSVVSVVQQTYIAARTVWCSFNSEPFQFYTLGGCMIGDGASGLRRIRWRRWKHMRMPQSRRKNGWLSYSTVWMEQVGSLCP